jgi:LPS O-antigen subunit length determinant protein (WzzB/FepE family)
MAEQDLRSPGAPGYDGFDDEIDLFELFQNLWEDKWLIGAITSFAAVVSVVVALWLPNVYQASTLLRPQSSEGGMGGLARQYGGLASLAGISLPSGDGQSKTQLALEVLKSKKFAYDFATRHDLLPALFAADSWDWSSQALSLDSSIYDPAAGGWVREVPPPRTAAPSPEEVHARWNETISVSEEKDSGFVTLSIKHRSPVYAKEWLDLLVVDINEALRAQDLAESERAVAYLEGQLKQTNVAEIRELLAGLLRSHMESRMMATVEPNYAFSVIDPPTIPELKSEPKRALICVLGTLLGGMLGVVFSLVRRALRNRAEGLAASAPGAAT